MYSGLYLKVEGDSTANNAEIKQYALPTGGYISATSGYKWRVYATSDGAVKIMPKSGEGTSPQRVMASATGNINGTHIQQRNFEGSIRNDEWYIISQYKYHNDLYGLSAVGITYDGHDHVTFMSAISKKAINSGVYDIVNSVDIQTNQQCSDLLGQSKIFAIRTHGGRVIDTSTSTVIGTGIVLANDYFSSNYLASLRPDYSNVDMVMFIACSTAIQIDNALNLPQSAVYYGADMSIGFSGSINCVSANEWTKDFFELYYNSDSADVNQIVNHLSLLYEGTGLDSAVIYYS